MLLATGVYRSLIEAVGQLCRLNITRRSLAPVVWIAIPAAVTIVSLAGAVSGLVQNHRPLAYATFIGLTLGGVPLLLRQLPKWTPGAKGGVVLGVMAMGGLAILESVGGFATTSGWVMAALAGMLGGASMILPGLSGGFVLLLLGQYVVILSAIDALKAFSRETGLVVEIHEVGEVAEDPDVSMFDQEFMRSLFAMGLERGRKQP